MNFNEWINYLHVHDNTTRGGVAPLSSLYVPPLTTVAGIKLWAYLVVTCGLCVVGMRIESFPIPTMIN